MRAQRWVTRPERLPDDSVDVVISNGIFNLRPDKPAVLAEAFGLLRPCEWLQIAHTLLTSSALGAFVGPLSRIS